ncbi:beta-N-acetylglucosaminidase domain-containing protein [Kitasatospora sp. NBC_00240]|uniref:beta-N-acetylglucosaminidase domain-containing protein n=1 Tax=Kitasatospora sp. NBC_00240 TaxID=2903567 RepID=UPI0022572C6E|nr:beta-N-acetylglucosaminidase domain-containing protein [Kitasatospora sp. NBC_00240]MCX5213335.1 beta-N-acetylglucosaminidase domain-containing protein [Kitasatospora sp. NBC_00240]
MSIARPLSAVALAASLAVGLAFAGPPPRAEAATVLPVVSPTPQSIQATGSDLAIPAEVKLLAPSGADPAAVDVVTAALRSAGAKVTTEATPSSAALTVSVGGPAENSYSAGLLTEIGASGPSGLASGGYRLATGTAGIGQVAVLSGVDEAGTFYAAQTLRQLLTGAATTHTLPGVTVRDWPGFAHRGGKEIFHGTPWSAADEDAEVDFLAAHKMNAFSFMPANDPRISGSTWRVLYPTAELPHIAEVVARGRRQHVDVMYRINPEAPLTPSAGICHGLQSDLDALTDRLQQVYDQGVRTFIIGWDDVSQTFTCSSDNDAFGSDASPLAAAQAHVLNYVQKNFIATHSGADLITIPTGYWGTAASTYRTRLSALIPSGTTVYWTGTDVDSGTITTAQATTVKAQFGGRPLLIFDNYPVNDYVTDRLLLGPLQGRSKDLDTATVGLTANQAIQYQASLIPLYTIADYTWNPAAYSAGASWNNSLLEFAHGDTQAYGALRVFAENNYSSILTTTESPTLTALAATFWSDYSAGRSLTNSGQALYDWFGQMASAQSVLTARLGNAEFLSQAEPWLNKHTRYGLAGQTAVRLVQAAASGDGSKAASLQSILRTQRTDIAAIRQRVATGVADTFLAKASAVAVPDLALRAPITASSTLNSARALAYAVDGDSSTRWTSAYADPQWLRIDLGTVRQVTGVRLNWEAAYATAYQVQVSTDGTTWTTLWSTTAGTGGVVDLTGLNGSGRYVRLSFTKRVNNAWGYSLWDVNVYGR